MAEQNKPGLDYGWPIPRGVSDPPSPAAKYLMKAVLSSVEIVTHMEGGERVEYMRVDATRGGIALDSAGVAEAVEKVRMIVDLPTGMQPWIRSAAREALSALTGDAAEVNGG